MSVCDKDCEHCKYPDCINDTMDHEDYVEAAKRDKALLATQKSRKAAAYKKAYYEANREKLAAQQKAYYEANREKVAAQQKAYREANREKVAARKKAYYEANRLKQCRELFEQLPPHMQEWVYHFMVGLLKTIHKRGEAENGTEA